MKTATRRPSAKFKPGMKQVGIIRYGAGLNARAYIDEAKAAGFSVLLRNGFAEIWR